MSASSPITIKDAWFTGEDQNIDWDIRDPSGAQVDITGWTIQFRMATAQGGTSVLTKSGSQILDARTRIAVDAVDTSGLVAGKYWYALSRTDAGVNQVLAYGDAHLQARVI
jgi:hypothetical protein